MRQYWNGFRGFRETLSLKRYFPASSFLGKKSKDVIEKDTSSDSSIEQNFEKGEIRARSRTRLKTFSTSSTVLNKYCKFI